MRIIMLGAPGAGKGTQAQILADKFAVPKLSTGDILRQANKKNDPASLELKAIMDKGNLVPDSVVIQIVANRLQEADCAAGFILDGFPRTEAQAVALGDILRNKSINDIIVINLEVDSEELVRRISGRFTCANCGASYNRFSKKPKIDNTCDECGSNEFNCRDDDNETSVRQRLTVYSKQTEPLKKFYENQGNLISINGKQSIDLITRQIEKLISVH